MRTWEKPFDIRFAVMVRGEHPAGELDVRHQPLYLAARPENTHVYKSVFAWFVDAATGVGRRG